MEQPESSSPYSQAPATCPYPELSQPWATSTDGSHNLHVGISADIHFRYY